MASIRSTRLGLLPLFACLFLPLCAETLTIQTLAGSSRGSSDADGPAAQAQYNPPQGLCVDSSGTVYCADTIANTIRKVSPSGTSTTLAGFAYVSGSFNGTGYLGRFNLPAGVAVDSAGNVYVADTGNNLIRKITAAGLVTTFAGSGTAGTGDGNGTAAQFSGPKGIAIDSSGTLYVADTNNYTIRKITPAGVVTTLAGVAGVYGDTDGSKSAAQFGYLNGITVDSSGKLYVSDSNNTIRKITPAGDVTTLAGSSGTTGFQNGLGAAASFDDPRGVAVDSAFNVYVADFGNNAIRKITAAGAVSTFAANIVTHVITPMTQAYEGPVCVAVDAAGNLYFGDSFNCAIQ